MRFQHMGWAAPVLNTRTTRTDPAQDGSWNQQEAEAKDPPPQVPESQPHVTNSGEPWGQSRDLTVALL